MSDPISRQAAIDAVMRLSLGETDATRLAMRLCDYLERLPSAQPERLTDDDFETIRIHLNAYKEKLCNQQRWKEAEEYQRIIDRFMAFASAQPEPEWIPFKTRPLTEEEKEEYPEWYSILDCKLPDDGQQILISVSVHGHECVQYDEFYTDDGSYLDSGYEIGTEAVAWMPLPEPYKERRKE